MIFEVSNVLHTITACFMDKKLNNSNSVKSKLLFHETFLGEGKENSQTLIQYLQNTDLTCDLYPKYLKNFLSPTRTKKLI